MWKALALLSAASVAQAQEASQEHIFSHDLPIKVTSVKGIEWRRDDKMWIARGDVIAEQGLSKLFSQVLIAHYRSDEDEDKSSKQLGEEGEASLVTRIEAESEMRVETPNLTATGHKGSYDVEKMLFTVKGKGSKVVFANGIVVGADEILELWESKNLGVAKGNAWVKRPDGALLRGERLVAYFAEEKAEGQQLGELEKVDAFDRVSINQKQERIRGDKGVYESKTGIATVIGNVVITRPSERFEGEYGTMNLNTGISRLLALPSGVKPPPLSTGRDATKKAKTEAGGKAPPKRVRAVIDLSKRKSQDAERSNEQTQPTSDNKQRPQD